MSETKADGRDETPDERADRNWAELLQELRVSQIGVQLLAASLVTLPFQASFADLDTFQKQWYLSMVALALLTVGVTLAPVAIHRRTFQNGAKEHTVKAAHVLTTITLGLIALLLAGIAFLVVDVVLSRNAATGAGVSGLIIGFVLLVAIPRLVGNRAERASTAGDGTDQST